MQRGPPRIEIVNRKGSRSVPNMGELIDLLTHFDEEKLGWYQRWWYILRLLRVAHTRYCLHGVPPSPAFV